MWTPWAYGYEVGKLCTRETWRSSGSVVRRPPPGTSNMDAGDVNNLENYQAGKVIYEIQRHDVRRKRADYWEYQQHPCMYCKITKTNSQANTSLLMNSELSEDSEIRVRVRYVHMDSSHAHG